MKNKIDKGKNMKEDLDFEEAMNKLEKIATELENEDLKLEEAVAKFEEGMKISKECSDILENAEKIITILLKDADNIKEENFVQEEE